MSSGTSTTAGSHEPLSLSFLISSAPVDVNEHLKLKLFFFAAFPFQEIKNTTEIWINDRQEDQSEM